MKNKLALKLFKDIINRINSPELKNNLSISEQFIKKYFNNNCFYDSLNLLINNNDYSCKGIFNLCKQALNELSDSNLTNGFLSYTYAYTLNKSFPHAVSIQFHSEIDKASQLYLEVLKIISNFQKNSLDNTWQSKYPLVFLTAEEENNLENPEEYRNFVKVFNDDYVYEMMKLSQEVKGFSTLDHICGVHFLAITIARSLQKTGLPIDLGRVSGAAAGHDIGKFGCSLREAKRVPYLHYYYTDQWFKKHNINYIRHIAINHSTWDLELENLSLESLILIYSDFRVKARSSENSDNQMFIYSLQDSFDVILEKLDNVDDAKEKRYRRVYAKLKDFEDYMISLGVNVNPCNLNNTYLNYFHKNNYSLLHGNEVIQNLKYLSINHNINLMYQLRDEASLNTILEHARSQKDWRNLREYLNIFEEYSTYLTQKQKLITLKYLYDQLTHPEDDIRKQSSELMGTLIATFDEEYRKEIPENAKIELFDITSLELLDKYLEIFIYPDHKIIPEHKAWIGYSLSPLIRSLFAHCHSNQIDNFRKVLLKYYTKNYRYKHKTKLYLLEASKHIPQTCEEKALEPLNEFILQSLRSKDFVLRLCALDVIYSLGHKIEKNIFLFNSLKEFFELNTVPSNYPSENFLNLKVARLLKLDDNIIEKYAEIYKEDISKIPEIYLSNLKTATDWIMKKVQVDMLLEYTIENPKESGFHTAMHFCNILKVSAVEAVRNRAGDALVKIVPYLSIEQRNDVTVELLRALEIDGYRFAKYIPYYLGKIVLCLQPNELDEIIDDLIDKNKKSGSNLNSLLLKTIGIAITNYSSYKNMFNEQEKSYNQRLTRMLGILLNGLVNYDIQVKLVAVSVIGKDLFGSRHILLDEKMKIFQLIAKKILTLITDNKEENLLFLSNSAGLNHIYRFISDYNFFKKNIALNIPEKIAFFPGTFDPFSLSHKKIAKQIRSLGFEVYLSVDEFSWSKQTLPNLIRRNIINMSIADELNIYLFPDDLQVNISNPENLRSLKNNFPKSEIYIVIGSDVILNASSYKNQKSEDSIHTFPHIIFERRNFSSPDEKNNTLSNAISNLEGRVLRLMLPDKYEDISSTQIRNYIDQNRDISSLIDPLAQKYIYEHGFYQREPQYKSLMQSISINVEVVDNITDEIIHEVASTIFHYNYDEAVIKLKETSSKNYSRLILIRHINSGNRIIAFSAFHWVRSNVLFHELKNSTVSEYVRENAVGRNVLIDGIFIDKSSKLENLEQIILTETLAFCLAQDYSYAIFKNSMNEHISDEIYEILELQGFQRIGNYENNNPILVVNMASPCTLYLDIDTLIKEPFRSNESVKKAIARSRKRLQKAYTMFYPGHLVLSFDRNMLYETLIKKICLENNVPTTATTPRKLGSAMCIPFGNILKRYIVPNTITKSLHTEKIFNPDLKTYYIGPYPYYLDLENQMKMLSAFNRSVILIDDLLHKGYRIKALDPLLKKENLKVQKIIVGLLSGQGKELMDIQDREVESAYYIPKIRVWFNESGVYPFMGGDALLRGNYPQRNLIPSVNLILPYASPTFIKGSSNSSIYNFSEVCIENAIDIFSTLESEYQAMNERNLTLWHLGQVFISPRCPDHGEDIDYDLNLSPSHYLKNDLELLRRIQYMICK